MGIDSNVTSRHAIQILLSTISMIAFFPSFLCANFIRIYRQFVDYKIGVLLTSFSSIAEGFQNRVGSLSKTYLMNYLAN